MEVLYERCAGLDVHKQTVVACVLTSTAKGKASQEVETFGTRSGASSRWRSSLRESIGGQCITSWRKLGYR